MHISTLQNKIRSDKNVRYHRTPILYICAREREEAEVRTEKDTAKRSRKRKTRTALNTHHRYYISGRTNEHRPRLQISAPTNGTRSRLYQTADTVHGRTERKKKKKRSTPPHHRYYISGRTTDSGQTTAHSFKFPLQRTEHGHNVNASTRCDWITLFEG